MALISGHQLLPLALGFAVVGGFLMLRILSLRLMKSGRTC
jgi:hypothetical protein